MAHDIFISYSERDKNVAHAICASLEGAHMRCWYAPRNILAGEAAAEAIPKAIREARIFVLVFTDSANDSEQILREVNLAVTAGCAIIPYRLTRSEPSGDMGYYLGPVHWLDAMNERQARSIRSLTQICQAVLKGEEPRFPGREDGRSRRRKRLLIACAALIAACVAAVVCLKLSKKPAEPEEAPPEAVEETPFESVYEDSQSVFPDLKAGLGDIVTFGRYVVQSGEGAEPEPLTWRVLERDEESMLLVSEKVLEAMAFNSSEAETCWEDCSLRQWLNTDFPRLAFTRAEYACLAESEVKAEPGPGKYEATPQGGDTLDRVFLLSVNEAKRYFKDDESRRTPLTKRVMAMPDPPMHKYNKTAFWWLRTMGTDPRNVSFVSQSGTVMYYGDMSYAIELGVLPAVRVNIYSVIAASGLAGA
ncbi:MAG: toll/interleukin-1 receptor domain-containing protein [Clostridia bacterium]|nr:toll/interleukin-1 receptor domain-containing protein [Clostridia bacterium]